MKSSTTLLFLCLLALQLSAQRDSTWLKSNDLGNRYEGSYSKEVGNAAIEFISLTGGFEPYEFGKKQALKVGFCLPDAQVYFLKAEELRPTQYYWMQGKNTKGKPGWNQLDNWQADARLKQLGVSPDNLGLLVQVGGTGSRRYAPAVLYLQNPPDSMRNYVAKFRLGQSIMRGEAKIYKGLFERGLPSQGDYVGNARIRAKSGGSHFPVILPLRDLKVPDGWYTVVMELAKSNGEGLISFQFSFYHQALIPKH